jgi:serine O-acetyltransferase
MFEDFRADIARARTENFLKKTWFHQNVWVLLQPNTLVVGAYRFCRWARKLQNPMLRLPMRAVAFVIRRWMEFVTGAFIAPAAEIGPGFVIHNLYGVLIGGTRIGKNCTVASGAKISYAVKQIGDDVSIGMGAVIVEDVTIGNNVRVAPNALVFTDVPDNTTVIGNPARIRLHRAPLRPVQVTPAASIAGSVNGTGAQSAVHRKTP